MIDILIYLGGWWCGLCFPMYAAGDNIVALRITFVMWTMLWIGICVKYL